MDSGQNDKQPNRSIKIEESVEQSILVTGSKNIVITILKGIDKETLDKVRSIDCKEKGRAKVQNWRSKCCCKECGIGICLVRQWKII